MELLAGNTKLRVVKSQVKAPEKVAIGGAFSWQQVREVGEGFKGQNPTYFPTPPNPEPQKGLERGVWVGQVGVGGGVGWCGFCGVGMGTWLGCLGLAGAWIRILAGSG